MKFTKMEGCGNDYVYVNGFEEEIENPNQTAIHVSDRHFGIGSDGLIIINPSDEADFKMSMYNSDGSEGKMCGNGIRCVAKYVYDNKMTTKDVITVETLSGIKTLKIDVKDGEAKSVRVNMGKPETQCEKIPVIFNKKTMVNELMTVNNIDYKVTCISMGNPHVVTFINDTDGFEIEKYGPLFENNDIFPDRVNTEFIQVIDRNTIKMRVWERGSGETLACGTGACASVVACVLNGVTENTVKVKVLGGELVVEYNQQENIVYMTGPAKSVYVGEIEI